MTTLDRPKLQQLLPYPEPAIGLVDEILSTQLHRTTIGMKRGSGYPQEVIFACLSFAPSHWFL